MFSQSFSHYRYVSTISMNAGKTAAKVILAQDVRNNKQVVCKLFDRADPNFDSVEQEIRVHQLVSHPNIVPILDVLYEEDKIIIIMDHYPNGNLLALHQEQMLPLDRMIAMFYQVVQAVVYLHKHGIAHLDIRPENVLVDRKYNALICDFGCCETPVSRKKQFYSRGTLIYSAPEMFENGSSDNRAADIWSLGVVLYAITSNFLPWKNTTEEGIREEIKGGVLNYLYVPTKIAPIVKLCCKVDPKDRINATNLAEQLKKLINTRTHKIREIGSHAGHEILISQNHKKDSRKLNSLTPRNFRLVSPKVKSEFRI